MSAKDIIDWHTRGVNTQVLPKQPEPGILSTTNQQPVTMLWEGNNQITSCVDATVWMPLQDYTQSNC